MPHLNGTTQFERGVLHDRTPIRHWLTTEDRVLRELYETQGPTAAAAALPGRTVSAIYTRATTIGLKAPRPVRLGKPRRSAYTFTPAIDAEIRRVYQTVVARGALNALCARLMMPRHSVSRRAQLLGLLVPRFREPPWSEKEIELLHMHTVKTAVVIQRLLKRAGFTRTATAITVKRKRLHLPADEPGTYSANGLAKLMGVDGKTVTRWIHREGLRASRRGTKREAVQGGDEHRIVEKDLRTWIRKHPQVVDLRKVDRFWFLELVFGAPSIKEVL